MLSPMWSAKRSMTTGAKRWDGRLMLEGLSRLYGPQAPSNAPLISASLNNGTSYSAISFAPRSAACQLAYRGGPLSLLGIGGSGPWSNLDAKFGAERPMVLALPRGL